MLLRLILKILQILLILAILIQTNKKSARRDKTHRAQSMQGAVGNRAYRNFIYSCRCFTAPNVVSIRLAAETGPRNRRVANVSRLPSNATSSI